MKSSNENKNDEVHICCGADCGCHDVKPVKHKSDGSCINSFLTSSPKKTSRIDLMLRPFKHTLFSGSGLFARFKKRFRHHIRL